MAALREGSGYPGEPVSAYQREMRSTALTHHACVPLGDVHLARTRLVPKEPPGADWHALLKVDPAVAAAFEQEHVSSAGWLGACTLCACEGCLAHAAEGGSEGGCQF